MNRDLTAWRKSSYSGSGNNCVELSLWPWQAGVRDSKNPDGPLLTFGRAELARFLAVAKAGRLDG